MALDVDRDPVADVVPRVVDRRQGLAGGLVGVEDRLGDRVGELGLGGGRVAENRLEVVAIAGDDPADFGSLAGERPGLVEEDRVDLVHQLDSPAVLDQDALAGG